MSTSVFPFSSSIKPLLLALILTPLPVLHADDWTLGRTIDGQLDLQGVWANNSITPEERPEFFGTRETMTEEEMQCLARRVEEIQSDGDALFGDSLLNAAFSGNESSRDTETGNYDQQWMADRTLHNRTSQVIDPPKPLSTENGTSLATCSRSAGLRGTTPGRFLAGPIPQRTLCPPRSSQPTCRV
jgi:hypothetical protein